MGTRSEVRNRIKKVMAELGLNNQAAFARALGLRPTTLNAWMTRTSLPSPAAYMALGKVALSVDDSLFFFEQAGLTEEVIRAAAAKIMKGRTGPGVAGEIIHVPRFRETEQGREEAGPPVPLPVELIPHPLATICLLVDEKSSGVVSAPTGLFILDTSVLGTANVLAHQERVVMAYVPESPDRGYPKGLCAGRVRLQQRQHGRRPDWGWLGVFLLPLQEHSHFASLGLASYQTPLNDDFGDYFELGSYEEIDAMRGLAWENEEERSQRFAEMWRRVGPNFPLKEGVRIIGRVIGRLTGHLEL
jgi:transcriptional regulator with XRE-family HTH domain